MKPIFLIPPAHPRTPVAIYVADNIATRMQSMVDHLKPTSVVILYDQGVAAIAKRIAGSLKQARLIAVESGDASKSANATERLANVLLKNKCDRGTLLMCVGGGMVTDLGGFLASIYMRGIKCVLVPTSMLGMVDAAIGGKTGINVGRTKNILGSFRHPEAIVIDTDIALALPDAQLREGLVEVVKIAAIEDRPFFAWLERHLPAILKRDATLLSECILRAVKLKARIVEEDERDTLVRLHLNFGHTVGHAVEAQSAFALPHGESVSIGMLAEMEMAGSEGIDRVQRLLGMLKMPTAIPAKMSVASLWSYMQSDKKNVGGMVRIAVPHPAFGHPKVLSITRKQFADFHARHAGR